MRKINAKASWFLAVMFPFFLQTASAQLSSADSTRLQFVLDSMRAALNIKGVSAAIRIPCLGTWTGVSGVSRTGVPISPTMRFGINSNTKTYTAIALLKLVEKDSLHLEDTIGKWIAPHPNIDPRITVRQLLNHTSGLDNYNASQAFMDSIFANTNRMWQPNEMLSFVGRPHFKPGTSWEYCNTGYLLAGMIMERIMNDTYLNIIHNLVLDPAGLNETKAYPYEAAGGTTPDQWSQIGAPFRNITALGYSHRSFGSSAFAAGCLFSSASDNALFWSKLVNGELLNTASMNQLLDFIATGTSNDYGLGIQRYPNFVGRNWYGHGGTGTGYINENAADPISRISISVLTNQDLILNEAIHQELVSALLREILKKEVRDTVTIDTGAPMSNTNFHTLTGDNGLFDKINRLQLSGNLQVLVKTGTTEPGTHALNSLPAGGCGHSPTWLNIQPESAGLKTIQGSYPGYLIRIQGADGIIISGKYNGSGAHLLFKNTHSSGGALLLEQDADKNQIEYLRLEGNAPDSNHAVLCIREGSDENLFSNDSIGSSSNAKPYHAILATGSNRSNIIQNSWICGFGQYGIKVSTGSGNGWKIENNSFYNTGNNPNIPQTAIGIMDGSGHNISTNYIGGMAPGLTGNSWTNTGNIIFTGIQIHSGSGSPSIVHHNRIGNIFLNSAQSPVFNGIVSSSGKVNIFLNVIGGNNTNSGIRINSGNGAGKGGKSTAILAYGNGPCNINYNQIRYLTQTGSGQNSQLRGICHQTTASQQNINNNKVTNLSTTSQLRFIVNVLSSASENANLVGILVNGTGNENYVLSDTVINLTNNYTGNAHWTGTIGIALEGNGSAGFCGYNFLYNLYNRSTAVTNFPGIVGIRAVASGGNWTIFNNSISITNGTYLNAPQIHGIMLGSAIANVYYNTVYLGGASTLPGAIPFTAACDNYFPNALLSLANNIFYNDRSKALGQTGLNFAFSMVAGSLLWYADYNNLYSSNLGLTCSYGNQNFNWPLWVLSLGKELHGMNRPVTFVNTTDNLRPLTNTNCYINDAGIPITIPGGFAVNIFNDIINTNRSNVAPDLGCYEWNSTVSTSALSNGPVCLTTANHAGSNIVLTAATNAPLPVISWTGPNNFVAVGNPALNAAPTAANELGIYTATATDFMGCISTGITLVDQVADPVVVMGGPITICAGSNAVLNTHILNFGAGVPGAILHRWTSNGTGFFTPGIPANVAGNTSAVFAPSYKPSAADIANGTVTLTYRATNACGEFSEGNVQLIIRSKPTIGIINQQLCWAPGDGNIALNANAQNAANITWQFVGNANGCALAVAAGQNAQLTTNDAGWLANGTKTITLRITATPMAPCVGAVSKNITVQIKRAPVINGVPANAEVCMNDLFYQVPAGVTVTMPAGVAQANFFWEAAIGNILDFIPNNLILSPAYFFGPMAAGAGGDILKLEATAANGCKKMAFTNLVITGPPTVNITGAPYLEVCWDGVNPINLNSIITNQAPNGILWEKTALPALGANPAAILGSGVLANANMPNATYMPEVADINFVVGFKVTVQPKCVGDAPATASIRVKICRKIEAEFTLIPIAPCVKAGDELNGINSPTVMVAGCGTTWTWTTNTNSVIHHPGANPGIVIQEADLLNGFVDVTLTVTNGAVCNNEVITQTKRQLLRAQPIADAGMDDWQCGNNDYQINDANAQYATSLLWTHNGQGAFYPSDDLINPFYATAAADLGNTVQFTLTASNANGCPDAVDVKEVEFLPAAWIAANPINVCAADLQINVNANGGGTANFFWTTSGTGTFINPNVLSPIYLPSVADKNAGSVVLTGWAFGAGFCGNGSVDVPINFEAVPVIDAVAAPFAVCENNNIDLSVTSNATDLQWTILAGNGILQHANQANATYVTNPADIDQIVQFRITAAGTLCAAVTQEVQIQINPRPEINAGADLTVCGNPVPQFALNAMNIGHPNGITAYLWSTSGSGTFDNVGVPNPMYLANAADVLNGSVTLTVTAQARPGCLSVSDELMVQFESMPEIFHLTAPNAICESNQADLMAVTNGSNLQWQVIHGNGSLTNPNDAWTSYLPAAGDAGQMIQILLQSNGNVCPSAFQWIQFPVHAQPAIEAGIDLTICSSITNQAQLLGAFALNPASVAAVQWSTSGSGTFDFSQQMNPTYQASPLDISTGYVTLTITAEGLPGCSTVTDQLILQIDQPNEVSITAPVEACQNSVVTFIANGIAMDYQWTVLNGSGLLNNNGLSVVEYLPGPGDENQWIQLMVTSTSNNTCPNVSATATTYLNGLPAVNAGPDVTIQEGDPVVLNGNAFNALGNWWSTLGDGTFGNNSFPSTVYQHGTGDVTANPLILHLEAWNMCGMANDEMWLTIIPDSVNNDTIMVSTDTTIVQCKACNLNQTAKQEQSAKDWNMQLYPNPAQHEFRLLIHTPYGFEGKIRIMDLTGRTILEKPYTFIDRNNELSIDISNLSPAVYQIVIQNQETILDNQKLIINR